MPTSPLSWIAQKILFYSLEHSVTGGAEIPESVCPADLQSLVHRELLNAGLVLKDDRLAGAELFDLSREGQATARQVSRGFRRRSVQQVVLEAVAEGDVSSTMDITFDSGGEAVRDGELDSAGDALMEWKLIDGTKSFGPGVIRPTITNLGHHCLESGYAPQDFVTGDAVDRQAGARGGDTNFYGPVGAAQWGNHNTAHVDQRQGANLDDVLTLLSATREIANHHQGDNPQGVAAVTQQAALIEEDARGNKWERVAAAVNAMITTATVTLGAEAGREIATHVPAFLSNLT